MPAQRYSRLWFCPTFVFFPYSPPIGWTIITPAPIGQLLQVALEHASVCLINATATGKEILKSLVLSDICFSLFWPPIGWTIFIPAPIGCRLPWSHRYGETQVPRPVRLLCFPYSPPIGWTIFYPCSHWSIIAGCSGARQRVPNQRYGYRHRYTQVPGPVQTFVFFPLLASYWLNNMYPYPHWSIIVGCPGARQRVPNQRHGHRYRDNQVSGSVLLLFFPPLATYWLDNIYPAPIGQLL
jgi:hypothetical protein